MKKLCVVATIPVVVYSFMQSHICASVEKWSVSIVSNPEGAELLSNMGAQFKPISFLRKISPLHDLSAFMQLILYFRREHVDLVHSIMPKTGMLAMIAARIVGVPNRVHTFTGQVWANKRGLERSLLKMFDKLIVLFATHIIVDSPSQRDYLIREGVLPYNKGIVIGSGSICGVDPQRFKPDASMRQIVRNELKIDPEHIVILFLGRLNGDKGMLELAQAFAILASRKLAAVLVLVGAEEDFPYSKVQEICGIYQNRLRRVGFTPYPERYMAAADIFCLPSHREGFGQVIIEAAASGVPTVATNIYGISDAIVDGKTGLLFPLGSVVMLVQLLMKLIEDSEVRESMGEAARVRALDLFSSKKITDGVLNLYEGLLRRD